MTVIDLDDGFFRTNSRRRVRIRKAAPSEFENEFAGLGDHSPDRRYVIAWLSDPLPGFSRGRTIKHPFLASADETIVDSEETARAFLDGMMRQAAVNYGLAKPIEDRKVGFVMPGSVP